jgi:hypothetical protein
MIPLENRQAFNTFSLLPLGLMSIEMAHPLLIRRDANGVQVGSQADIDYMRPRKADGTSTGAFMNLQEFYDANKNPDGGCNYFIPIPSTTHFILQFPFSAERSPLLGLNDFDRIYAMTDDSKYGLVELQDFTQVLKGNEFKLMTGNRFQEFKEKNPIFTESATI